MIRTLTTHTTCPHRCGPESQRSFDEHADASSAPLSANLAPTGGLPQDTPSPQARWRRTMAWTRHRLDAWHCRGAVALCLWFLTGGQAHAQPEEELEALNRSAIEHHKAGKVEEATFLA